MKTQTETKPKVKKEKKVSRNSTHYLIHVYHDKDLLKHAYSAGDVPSDKKKAKNMLTDLIATDLMHNRYYFYEFIEQSFTTLEIYPTIK
jgi:hypothetical protein